MQSMIAYAKYRVNDMDGPARCAQLSHPPASPPLPPGAPALPRPGIWALQSQVMAKGLAAERVVLAAVEAHQ
jgi:hypothetical protein